LIGFGNAIGSIQLSGYSNSEESKAVSNQIDGSAGGTAYAQLHLSDSTTLTFWGTSSVSLTVFRS
jgi:hypothetical protein